MFALHFRARLQGPRGGGRLCMTQHGPARLDWPPLLDAFLKWFGVEEGSTGWQERLNPLPSFLDLSCSPGGGGETGRRLAREDS